MNTQEHVDLYNCIFLLSLWSEVITINIWTIQLQMDHRWEEALNEGQSQSKLPSWTHWWSVPHEFITRPQSLNCNFEPLSLRKICWCRSFGYHIKADRKEVVLLDSEGVDVWLEGAQEGGEVEQRRLKVNKCHHWQNYHRHAINNCGHCCWQDGHDYAWHCLIDKRTHEQMSI